MEEEEETIFEGPADKDFERDFEVFPQSYFLRDSEVRAEPSSFAQASANQEAIDILEGMVIKKTPSSFLSLFQSDVAGAPSEPPAPSRSPTPIPPSFGGDQGSPIEPAEKKRKRDKKHKKGVIKEGEIQVITDGIGSLIILRPPLQKYYLKT